MKGPVRASIEKGFSLVELMITVAILGVIAAIAIPSYNSYIEDTYTAQAVSDLKACGMALERYYSNDFTYANADTANVCITQSPAEGEARYDILYGNLTSSAYTITARPVGGSCGSGDCIILNQLGDQTID